MFIKKQKKTRLIICRKTLFIKNYNSGYLVETIQQTAIKFYLRPLLPLSELYGASGNAFVIWNVFGIAIVQWNVLGVKLVTPIFYSGKLIIHNTISAFGFAIC